MKLLIAATSGGHLTQAMVLFQNIPKTELIFFTEYSKRSCYNYKTYTYKRPKSQILTMLYSFFKALKIILKERPDWVITTGAECGTATILAATFLCRKTIFIETASRYKTKTVSAKICYPLVDYFFVQHPEALSLFGPKARYIGGVL